MDFNHKRWKQTQSFLFSFFICFELYYYVLFASIKIKVKNGKNRSVTSEVRFIYFGQLKSVLSVKSLKIIRNYKFLVSMIIFPS